MKLLLPTLTLVLSSTASAAECESGKGSNNCVTSDGIGQLQARFCDEHWGEGSVDTAYMDPRNGHYIRFLKSGNPFVDYRDCINITGDVIGTCFGKRDAGSWTIPSLRIFVDFCY